MVLYLEWLDQEPVFDRDGQLIEDFPEPPALYWKRWVDRYGLPNEGGWLNQPCFFIADIEAARKGIQEYLEIKRINEEQKAYGIVG